MLIDPPWHALSDASILWAIAVTALASAALLLLATMRRQRRSAQLMRGMLRTYMVVLDAIPLPIYLRDRDLKLIACNTAYAQACGQPRTVLDQASIDTAARWLGADALNLREIERQYRDVMNSGLPAVEDRTMLLRTGPATLQHWTSPLRDASNAIIGVVGGWLDVTERRRALNQLAEARDRAEAADRAKSTFLAAVSHDIRTPMNAIMGMLELTLLQASLTASERQQLDTALQSARSLLSLIDDLLHLSKMEAGKLDLKPAFVGLREVVEEVAGVFSPVANSKGLALNVDVSPSVAPAHFVDALRVKQILNNLVSNAIRFTEKGHVHIGVTATRIHEAHQWVQFSVTDTGIGIPPQALPVLFEPFMQVDGAASNGGVGLGLSICKRLTDVLGGYIRVRSTLEAGTQVVVRLKLPARQTPAEAVANAIAEAPAKPDGPASILVVDDQASNRILLGHQLRRLGHTVVTAENGLQALRAADKRIFKLVICDCSMPQMNGMEFVRALRKRADANSRIPVLGYTAGTQDTNMREALEAGMNMVLFKPVGLAELKAALRTHLPN
ncbi:response regulator [Bordetella petrii]|nr:response regulator [Bordetella petrii]